MRSLQIACALMLFSGSALADGGGSASPNGNPITPSSVTTGLVIATDLGLKGCNNVAALFVAANCQGVNEIDLVGNSTNGEVKFFAIGAANPYADFASTLTSFTGPTQIAATPVSTQTGAYTFTSTNCGTKVWDTGATAAHTFTVPTGLPVGCAIDIYQATSNALTVAAGSGETLGTPSGFSATLGGIYSHARIDVLTSTLADMHP